MNAIQLSIQDIVIGIKGAGEMASAIAWRLYMANFRRIFMMEIDHPLAVRRQVSFCESVHNGRQTVEGVTAVGAGGVEDVHGIWAEGCIPVLVDPGWHALKTLAPDVCVDAILAKRNLGTAIDDAPTVIGLGPGFTAGKDVHLVVETKRGHDLGRILTSHSAAPNTGIPGNIGGQTKKRVLRAPSDGRFAAAVAITDLVVRGAQVGRVGQETILAEVDGVVRGLIRPGSDVTRGMKLGDIDPRGDPGFCSTLSDKARAIAGTVIEAILRRHMPPALWIPSPSNGHDRTDRDTTALIQGVFNGDIRSISRAINIIETEGPDSTPLTDGIFPHAGKAHRIGVTGPPGAGKSTFTAQVVKRLRAAGQTVGVVAVDPSSPFTGGAFFGDRLRMKAISGDTGVFIRSMATRGNLGGLSRRAADAADVLDAAGKDVIIFETAGVGQVELDVMSAADTVIVMAVPDAGDMIQGMKCGIMEIGDIYVVNKADLPGADAMKADIEAVLYMKDDLEDRWPPVVRTTDSRKGRGLAQILDDIDTHLGWLRNKGILAEKRMTRTAARVRALVDHRRIRSFWTDERVAALNEALRSDGGRSSPSAIAARILGE